jgi:hypothetical protein
MLVWLNDDEAREIDNDPSEVMFGESSESNMSRDELCPFIGQCSAIASNLPEGRPQLNAERTDHVSLTDGPCVDPRSASFRLG